MKLNNKKRYLEYKKTKYQIPEYVKDIVSYKFTLKL